MRVACHRRAQDALEFWLVEHVGRREAVGARLRVTLELGDGGHVRVDQAQAVSGARDVGERVGDAQIAEDAVHLVVEVDGTRLREDVLPPVEYEALDAVPTEQ